MPAGNVDTTGAYVVKYKYDAWGKPLSKTGSMAATLGTLQPFRYRHYAFDEETGMYYLQSRYYSYHWCRFINADDLILADFDVWDAKQFTYCGNNPVRYEDPSGNSFWDTLKKVAEAALVVAAVTVVVAAVIGTGGGAGFALAGGGVLAGSAASGMLGYAAAATVAAGTTLLFASKVGRDMSEYYQKKGTPKSNKAQNQQFDEAVRQLKKNHGIDMTKERSRRLHDAITKHGYDLYEIIEVGLELFGR